MIKSISFKSFDSNIDENEFRGYISFSGRLIPEKLEEMILASKNANEKPFLVMLTAGTTVLGSFDPIEPVADICQTHGLWLHVDVRYFIIYSL